MALVVVGAIGCSSKSTLAGGLMLEIGTDCTLSRVDSLHIEIRSLDLAKTYLKETYRIPGQTSLPASLAIRSNGDAHAAVAVELSLWRGGVPLDVRSHRILDIPTDSVHEVVVTFSARCSPRASSRDDGEARSTCDASETCNPTTGSCEPGERIGTELPPASAGAFPACPDAGVNEGAPDASDAAVVRDAEGGAAVDASDEPAADGASADADGASPDAGVCASGATRCVGSAAQQCDPSGQWQTVTTCADGEHCRGAGCEPVPPSCRGAPSGAGSDCRQSADSTGDCCASDEVPAGTFFRSYDGDAYTDKSHPATVSAFRLDDYEVTVGRFRQFVGAVVDDAWVPAPGAGKHAHVNGGSGLASGGSFEAGWDAAWNMYLSKTRADWDSALRCSSDYATWIPRADANERHPINCVNWYRAYAFCIWDGGFLPSEAEWNYAASAGSAQRRYPWGDLDPGANAELAIYDCYQGSASTQNRCTGIQNIAFVGLASAGRSAWGQWDLAGNLSEWTLDWNAPYADPCVDCAAVVGSGVRVDRGGGFYDSTSATLRAAARDSRYAQSGYADVGIRCARQP